ncbi:Rne/Rng family ribonuclease [Pseudobacteriovorax antillogorgiicola]|uniref:Ribonuclease G n=1 Tax=Pseudobacteriovorax antillogorgiicola TaxID=1513793 RepID=A0A1Y6CI55_9BACT|nr:Rne/Rng family ribonuclease [Pseudobacteriovorax antillogorgiicola]TCS46717.1 RNAse G [Pseudobacteriovorax antillogorgiicola]SMF67088.1 RNAse G [Pseudobacteriovorax antillogorgiicola]
MDKKLVINVNVSETRIALMEQDRAAELYVERQSSLGMVGNIYKAKVSRVLPGMQSAFVNIGSDRSAFLYGGDVVDEEYLNNLKLNNGKDVDPRSNSNKTPIEKILKEGDEIMVQVAKEPLGTKGPRVTMLITIPGRYLVLMPDFDNVGISRRIEDSELRDRLERDVEAIRPENMGLIVRTAAAEAQPENLKKDLDYLLRVWNNVKDLMGRRGAPALLYQEPDIILKTTRDLYSEDVSEIVVDDSQAHSQLSHFLQGVIPGADDKLKLHESETPIFDHYSLEIDIAKALSRKVWLPSGGYLVIDQTEALTSFDVNTGKYVGSHNARETILKTNLESVDEIVHQLRVRNLGGIIIIDFIDMELYEDQQQVNERLEEALKVDKSRTNVLAINELGLVQMTRKRTRESLERALTVECHYCGGSGRCLSTESAVLDLARDIERFALRTKSKKIFVTTRQDIIDRFMNEEEQLFQLLVERFDIEIALQPGRAEIESLQEALYDITGER